MATADNDRTIRINVRLAAHIKERLEGYSSHIGMAASTVAAFAIAEFLDNRERQSNVNKDIGSAMAPKVMQAMFDMTKQPEGLNQLQLLASMFGDDEEEEEQESEASDDAD